MTKSVLYSFIVVLILAVVVLWQQFYKPTKKAVLPYFNRPVTQFCINDICLSKSADLWVVTNGIETQPADNDTAEGMVKSLESLTLNSVVSTDKDRLSDLGFMGQKEMVISSGNKKLEVGGNGANYDSTLVREPNGTFVYQVPFTWSADALLSYDHWKNTRVTNLALYQIKKINDQAPDKDGKWKNEKWVEKVVHLSAINYLGTTIDSKQAIKLFTIDQDGQPLTHLTIGRQFLKYKWHYWASTDQKHFYEITKSDYDLLTSV